MAFEQHIEEEDLAAYSLGALPDDEALRVSDHLAGCAACRLKADELWAVVDLLPYGVPQLQPPPSLERRIMAAATPAVRRPWRLPVWGTAAAAAVLVAAFGIGGLIGRNWQPPPAPVAVTETKTIGLVGTTVAPGASAQLAVLHSEGKVIKYVLAARGLPALADNAVYTMWMTKDGRRWNCGSFKVDAGGNGMLAYDNWSNDYFDQVGITLEPEPNFTDQPRGSRVLGLST